MRQRRLLAALLGLILIAGLIALRIANPYPVVAVRELGFDLFQQLKPRAAADLPVRVVDIDEASLSALGQWPWPRDRLATLVERLRELGAAAIAFDVLFAEPDRTSTPDSDHDAQFAQAIGSAPVVLGFSEADGGSPLTIAPKGGVAISGTDPTPAVPPVRGTVAPLPALAGAASGLGSISLGTRDTVGVVRRLPLLWNNEGRLYPSLDLEALRLAMGLSGMVVLGETGTAAAVDGVRVGEFSVPTTTDGALWLYFRPPDPALSVSARQVLGQDYAALAPRIAGQIVLVGTSASGLLDIRTTPLGDNVPGVTIHAQALEQILSNTYLVRADWVEGLEIWGFALGALLLVLLVLRVGPRIGLMAGLLLGATTVALAWWGFAAHGLLIDASFALFGLLVVYTAMVFFRFSIADRDTRAIRAAFGHYVAPSLLAEIERNRSALRLGGEVRQLTVMFADMRNFTTVSETLGPRPLVNVLNTLFGALGEEITRTRGTIDKFIGDAVMAFWNAPLDVPEHPARACEAALAMRERLRALNAADAFGMRAEGRDLPAIAIGIGISSGEALVGNLGLETRFDYSCVGDTVNVASRVEGACKTVGYDILVVEATRAAAPQFATLLAGMVALKGRAERATIHLLVGDAALAQSTEFSALRDLHERTVAALQRGERVGGLIEECRAAAERVDPALQRFYSKLASRADDFSEPLAEAPRQIAT